MTSVLYIAPQYDYGRRERGHGFEHHNFYGALVGMGLDVTYFDYPTLFQELGRRAMNRKLIEMAKQLRPALVFGVVRNDLVDPRVMKQISAMQKTTTLNWFCDDHWQFESEAKRWTPCFNYVATTSQQALEKYRKAGFHNVIKTQWGCNHRQYRRLGLPLEHDVSFVGQCYGERERAVQALREAGINVTCWGRGWPNGGISQEAMIRVFNTSRINLNFADASASKLTWLDNLVAGRTMQSLQTKPVVWRAWDWSHRAAIAMNRRRASNPTPVPRQIKGRVFEVTGSGGFLLTQPAEDLTEYLRDGQEIALFNDTEQLVEQVRYYLDNEEKRRHVAERGYRRVINEHTYEHRFSALFQQMKSESNPAIRAAA